MKNVVCVPKPILTSGHQSEVCGYHTYPEVDSYNSKVYSYPSNRFTTGWNYVMYLPEMMNTHCSIYPTCVNVIQWDKHTVAPV